MQFLAAAAGAKLRAMRKALVLLFLAAGAARADTVVTKDGVRHLGRIIDRTEAGYVFREDSGETHVLDFAQVDDVQRSGVPADAPLVAAPPVQLAPRPSPIVLDIFELRSERREMSFFWPTTGVVAGAVIAISSAIALSNTYFEDTGTRTNLTSGIAVGVCLIVPSVIVGAVRAAHLHALNARVDALELQAAQQGLYVPPEG